MTVAETEIAWAAGFFDGEGSVGAYCVDLQRQANRSRLIACVVQKPRQPLDRFQRAMGGLGRISFRAGAKSPCHVWKVTSVPDVQRAYDTLAKYLSEPKQAQFATAFARWNARPLQHRPRTKQLEAA